MRTSQGNTLISLRAVQQFLDAHADTLGDVARSGTRQALDAIVARIDGHAEAQSAASNSRQQATRQLGALRSNLKRDHMLPIIKVARALELPDTPQLAALKVPTGRPNIELLRASAKGMAEAVAPYADRFVQAGLPADFIAQLTAAADALAPITSASRQSRARGSLATAGILSQLIRARKLVGALDAMVKRAAANDPSLLAGWASAMRADRMVGGQPARAAAPATPAQPQVPAAQPASQAALPQAAPQPAATQQAA